MKKIISIAIILVSVLTLLVPLCASADTMEMWVNCENGKTLNLREQPDTNARVLARLACGTRVYVMEVLANGWMRISTASDGSVGYVMSKFLVTVKPGKYEITERDDNFVDVTPYFVSAKSIDGGTRSVGLRVKPNKTANMIRRLAAGDELKVIARGTVWSKVIDMKTGKTGYVANDYISRI